MESSVNRYIRRGQPDAGFPLFESESLRWPGFVEFDDVNGKVLTYSAQDRYLFCTLCFFILDCDFQCLEISPAVSVIIDIVMLCIWSYY